MILRAICFELAAILRRFHYRKQALAITFLILAVGVLRSLQPPKGVHSPLDGGQGSTESGKRPGGCLLSPLAPDCLGAMFLGTSGCGRL